MNGDPSAASSDDVVRLAAHGFEMEASPAHGGLISTLVWVTSSGRRLPLLYCPTESRPSRQAPNRFGLWAMLPLANRAFGGIMDDGRERIALPLNDMAAGVNIHGFGWQSVWTVIARTPDRLVMEHRREAADDPYAYDAQLSAQLSAGCVRFDLSLVNRATRTLPFGMGLHPWFPARPDTTVFFSAGGCLEMSPGFRATGIATWSDGGPYRDGATRPAGVETAVSVLGWHGPARISSTSLGLDLEIVADQGLAHPVLWSPADADFVCFEPQSHASGAPSEAVARQATPLRPLAPGERMSGWMTLTPREC
jgi:aldose 1-epimerase